MKTIVLTLQIDDDPLAHEVGMGIHLSLQSDVGAESVIAAILAAADGIQRQHMIQQDEEADPSGDPDARATYAALASRLALIDGISHLPSTPLSGFLSHY